MATSILSSGCVSLSSLSLSKTHLTTYSSTLPFLHSHRTNLCIVLRRREKVRAAVGEVVADHSPLIMLFQAEGTMNEAAIPTVTKALETAEGISNLKVQLVEGIASVELKKETTLLGTLHGRGVASGLVELIQGSGFTLQTLNLSFEDEEVTNEIS